jgi:hypothetical protein
MTETVPCVFLPPQLSVHDIHDIVFYTESEPSAPPTLRVTISTSTFDLPPPAFSDGRLVWPLDTVAEFNGFDLESSTITVISGSEPPRAFDLHALVFLGPPKGWTPLPNIFLLECLSGLYAREADVPAGPIQFEVDSMLTLDYRNILTIRQHLDELSRSQNDLEQRKQRLAEAGIDLAHLAELKAEYEDAMKQRRRAQSEFVKQNQRMQAATFHQHAERDFESAKETLQNHIQNNQRKSQAAEGNRISHERLLAFRVAGLNELKIVFPFNFEERRLCGVQHFVNPSSSQWNETRLFLGFATHYIREVSRIVGVPLPHSLAPLGGNSKILARLKDLKTQLTTEYSPQNTPKVVQAYESALVACCKHIADTLQVSQEDLGQVPILGYLRVVSSISRDHLKVLMPVVVHTPATMGSE